MIWFLFTLLEYYSLSFHECSNYHQMLERRAGHSNLTHKNSITDVARKGH